MQAGAELGQAQLKLGLDLTLVNLFLCNLYFPWQGWVGVGGNNQVLS